MSVTHKPKTGPVLTGTEYEAADSHVSTDIPQGGPLTQALAAGGFKVTGLGAPVDPDDAVRVSDLEAAFGAMSLGTVLSIGNDANATAIVNMADPTNPQDAATKAYITATSQPIDATLTALAAANWAANAVPIGSGADALSQVAFAASTFPARASTGNLVAKTITDFGLSLIDDAAASNARTTLGLGTAAVAATGDFDAAGLAAAAAAASIAKTFLDAKGDLISASADNTPSLVTVGANDTILMADSVQAAGLKWVASQTPSTQAFSDAAAEGTADTYARGDHKHAMPASPAATVTWISIARWGL